MPSLGTVGSYPQNPRVQKIRIAAAYVGDTIDEKLVDLTKPRDAEFSAKFPMGKVPVFEGKQGELLFESNAIGYYALLQKDSPLVGTTPLEKAEVLQWLFFTDNEVNTNLSGWLSPLMGYDSYFKPSVDKHIDRFKRAMGCLNNVLLNQTYLVGESVTYADISLTCSLIWAFKLIFDPALRAEFKNVTRYFTTMINKKQFKDVIGDVALCETPMQPPKKEKKETKKPEPVKKAAPKKEAAAADDEEPAKPAPKPKSKLDLLPPSPFVLDEWKRMYSNNDSDVAAKWFWEHFDSEGWSLWRVDYKYNDELTMVFMSNNLIGGFFARLEMARKYAFGSMIVCGTNNNNAISGYFVIRGQEVPFEVYDAADFGSYNFVKIEPSQYDEKKKEIEQYLAWEVEGFADGKIFK
ncbi:EF1G-domain-containing protein [Hesseltinella vesiculosa]|uniref:EF1G-domain-containing protein n=1 Tax=Hesseltinella vesiculosa TaxID=101127 RepID=A0A1X2GSP9_9FUNG|nr:EF1G-domain-containing protein [Hesseltinella vesiculosa]